MTKKFLLKYKCYLIDFIFNIIFLTFLCFDVLYFKINIEKYFDLFPKIPYLIEILLPSVITIISISLSMNRDEVYGCKIKDINTIRSYFDYSFLHVAMIMCEIAFFYFILEFLDVRLSSYVLSLISFFYCIYFLIQEIPLMLGSFNKISSILKRYFKRHQNIINEISKNDEKIFYVLIQNIILIEGIDKSFNILNIKGKESYIVSFLLNTQNKYLLDIKERMPLSVNASIDYSDVNKIIDFTLVAFSNVKQILFNENSKYTEFISKNEYYLLTRSLFYLHDLCDKFKIEKEKKMFDDIIYCYLSETFANKNSFAQTVITAMFINTIKEGETWFIKKLRDNNYFLSFIFNFDNCLLGIYFTIIIFHLYEQKILTKDKKENIDNFLNEKEQGLNSFGQSWIECLEQTLENVKTQKIVNSLPLLIKYFDSIVEEEYYFRRNDFSIVHNASENFTKSNLIDKWIEMIIFSIESGSYDTLNFSIVFENLDENNKNILFSSISNNWLIDGKLNIKNNSIFEKLFFGENYVHDKGDIDLIEKILKDLPAFYETRSKSIIDSEINKNEDLEKLNKKIFDSASKQVKTSHFYDGNLIITRKTNKYFKTIIYGSNYEDILNAYLNKLDFAIIKMIIDEIKVNVKPNYKDDCSLTDEDAKKILSVKPDLTTRIEEVKYYCSDGKYSKEMKELNLKEINGIPLHLYEKENAIRFNAEVDRANTMIRQPNDEEIENIIQNKYQIFPNGLYRYSEYHNNDRISFYVTKEQLKEYLKKQVHFIIIGFKFNISINKDECILFEYKN